MVSLLVSREFGFKFNLTKEEIDKVLVVANNKRNKTYYISTKDSMELCNTVEKNTKAENTLLSNPFRRDFEYGKGR